jgi:signal transduction histidine kinase
MEKRLSKEKMEALVDFQEKINGKFHFEEMINFLVRQVVDTLKVQRCSIFKVSEKLEKSYLIAGEPKGGHRLGMVFDFNELKTVKEVVRTKEYLLIEDPMNDERCALSHSLVIDKAIKAILFVPIITQKEVVGILVIDATENREIFTEEEIYFCSNIANLVSLLLERDFRLKEEAEGQVLALLNRAAAEAAHRLRNPVTVIGGFARKLAEELKDSSYEKKLSIILDEIEVLEKLVDDLTSSVRFRRNRLKKIDINKNLKIARDLINEFIGERKIEFIFQLDNELPKFSMDPNDIKNVALVILRNAVESIKREGVICIKTQKEKEGIKISFANTGGCIDKEIAEEIFNPFFTTKPGSIGLGLAVANSIVSSYGGEIKLDTDGNSLTTFVIKIPFKKGG